MMKDDGNKKNVSECGGVGVPEVLPAEGKAKRGRPPNLLQIAPIRSEEERVRVIGEYHQAAQSCYAASAMYVLLCGFELHAERARIKHGGWMDWVERNCPFSHDTAGRYMEAAERKYKDIPNIAHVRNFIIGKSPLELPAAEREELIQAVKAATDGETVRQMYLELGMIQERAKPKIGGDTSEFRKPKTTAEKLDLEKLDANEQIDLAVRYLREFVQKKRFVHVHPATLKSYRIAIEECVKELKHAEV